MKIEDIVKGLNPDQLRAVEHTDGPLLIVAGAGTGKTTVVTKRIAWLITSGKAKTDEILALTFTEKAASEMEERVDRMLPYGYVDLWISTFHAFCDRILREHGLEIGLPTDYKLLDTTAQWMLVRKHLDRFNLSYYRPLGNPTKFIHALLRHVSRAKDEVIGPQEYLKYAQSLSLDADIENPEVSEAARVHEIANTYHTYQQLLLASSALDFGDLVNYCLTLFKERPNVLKKYQEQFKYIMVDEFQDTNIAQYELVKMLAGEKQNIAVVCDDDQSIYKFRGASVSNILAFEKDFPHATRVFVVENFRSYQNILDTAYEFIIKNNPNRLEFQLNKSGMQVLNKRLIAKREGTGMIDHLHFNTGTDEASGVAHMIAEIMSRQPSLSWRDFAILVRANDAADPFIRAFAHRGMPYEFLASRGLYNKGVVLDVLAYLRVLANFHDSVSLYRVLSIGAWDITVETIATLSQYAHKKGISLFDAFPFASALSISTDDQKKLVDLQTRLADHARLSRTASVGRVVLELLNKTPYLLWLVKSSPGEADQKTVTDTGQLAFLNQLYKKIQQFEETAADSSVSAFVDLIDLELESSEQGALSNEEDSYDTIKILTIHASKGLEWPFVFVTGMVDRRFPTIERKDPIELPDALIKEIVPEGDMHLEEERRLCYVAVTRARDGIFFTSAEDYGGARKKKLSRFLYELGVVKEAGSTLPARTRMTMALTQDIEVSTTVPITTPSGKVYSLPLALSFTQLKAFETCPLQYKFAHILKIPVSGRPSFSYGKSMHKTLEVFFKTMLERAEAHQGTLFAQSEKKEGVPVSQEELLEIYEEAWIDDWYPSKKLQDEYYEKGKASLIKLYEHVALNPVMPLFLEQTFTLKINDPLDTLGTGIILKGAIDRMDPGPDGSVRIIDYKTGKVPERPEKDQLIIYQIAAEESFGKNVHELTYYYLEDGSTYSFLATQKEKDTVKERIQSIVAEMKTSIFPATPEAFTCKFCDFKDICEYKTL